MIYSTLLRSSLFLAAGLLMPAAACFADPAEGAAFTAACQRLSKYSGAMSNAELVALICKNGAPTPLLTKLLQAPYTGQGYAKAYEPLSVASAGGYTEMMVAGATRYPLSVDALVQKNDKAMLVGTEIDHTVVETTLNKSDGVAAGAAQKHCSALTQRISSQVLFFSFGTQMEQTECIEYLPGDLPLAVASRTLDPGAANDGTKFDRQLFIYVQVASHTTYGLLLTHISIANHHAEDATEGQIRQVPPAVAASLFKAVTAN